MKKSKYTIAFLGTDGSGKSTVINILTPMIKQKTGYVIRYEHLRPNYIPSLAVATGRHSKEDEANCGPSTAPHALPPSSFIISLVRLSYYMIDYTFGYFMKVFKSRNVVWIFDRYFYDYYIDQRRARISLPTWILKVYGLLVPSPDLILCLGGDPVKIYARKPETSLDEVTRQVEVLRAFCDNNNSAHWVDTTTSLDETVNRVKALIDKNIR